MRLAIFFFVGVILVIPPVVFSILFLPDFELIEYWLIIHGVQWLRGPIAFIIVSLPFVAAAAGYFVFERYVGVRLSNWLISTLIPIRDNER